MLPSFRCIRICQKTTRYLHVFWTWPTVCCSISGKRQMLEARFHRLGRSAGLSYRLLRRGLPLGKCPHNQRRCQRISRHGVGSTPYPNLRLLNVRQIFPTYTTCFGSYNNDFLRNPRLRDTHLACNFVTPWVSSDPAQFVTRRDELVSLHRMRH